MISLRRSLIPLVLIGTVTCSLAWCGEPNNSGSQLVFQESPVVPRPTFLSSAQQEAWEKGSKSFRPEYAAGVATNDVGFFPREQIQETIDAFISFANQQDISERQKAFLRVVKRWSVAAGPGRYYIPDNDPNHAQVLLYAVSQEDAKKMAVAYLQFAEDTFNKRTSDIRHTIQSLSDTIAEGEKRLAESEKLLADSQKSLEEMKKAGPYRRVEEATEAVGELNKMLNASQVEISGIRAKIEAIQSYQQNHRTDGTVSPAGLSRLDDMFVEESITLKGAEARKRTATDLRTQADKFIELNKTIADTTERKERLAQGLPFLGRNLKANEERLAQELQQQPKVLDNKVFIYRVGDGRETQGQPSQ